MSFRKLCSHPRNLLSRLLHSSPTPNRASAHKVVPQNFQKRVSTRLASSSKSPADATHLFSEVSSGRRALSRGNPSRPFSPHRRSVRGVRTGDTRYGRGQEGKETATRGRQKGVAGVVGPGDLHRYPPASERRLCIYACFVGIACFLPITRAPFHGEPGRPPFLRPRARARFFLRVERVFRSDRRRRHGNALDIIREYLHTRATCIALRRPLTRAAMDFRPL